MTGGCRKQCSLKAFSLGGEDPNKFASPQAKWPLLPVSFIVYRIIYALYQLIVQILLLVHWGSPPFYTQKDNKKAKMFIYISYWTFLLHTIYTIWSAVTASYWHLKGKAMGEVNPTTPERNDLEMTSNSMATGTEGEDSMSMAPILSTPWYFKMQLAMQNILCEGEMYVTCLYWILLYDPGEAHFFSVHVHGVALGLVVLDFFLVANPFRYLHFIYSTIFSIVYVAFTYIYFLAGGRNPYGETAIYGGFLDWGASPGMSFFLAAISVCLGTPLLNGVFFLLYLLKLSFGKCCGCYKPEKGLMA